MGGTRVSVFFSPKNFFGFRPVHKKTRVSLAYFLRGGGGQQLHEYGKFQILFFLRPLFRIFRPRPVKLSPEWKKREGTGPKTLNFVIQKKKLAKKDQKTITEINVVEKWAELN